MARTVDEMQAALDELYRIRDAGTIRAQHGDQSTQFDDYAGLQKRIEQLEAEIDGATGSGQPTVVLAEQGT